MLPIFFLIVLVELFSLLYAFFVDFIVDAGALALISPQEIFRV